MQKNMRNKVRVTVKGLLINAAWQICQSMCVRWAMTSFKENKFMCDGMKRQVLKARHSLLSVSLPQPRVSLPVLYQKEFSELREQNSWSNKVIITTLKGSFASPIDKKFDSQYCPEGSVQESSTSEIHPPTLSQKREERRDRGPILMSMKPPV